MVSHHNTHYVSWSIVAKKKLMKSPDVINVHQSAYLVAAYCIEKNNTNSQFLRGMTPGIM